jgi:pterin-4a-carbinolamine dehydratase
MLKNYLRTLYLNRVVPLNSLRQELNSWNIVKIINKQTETRLERSFNFVSFERAVEFMSMANSYTNDKGINSIM